MATWDVFELDNEKCPSCGTVYAVRYKELPLKDKDRFTCSCGELMRSWKETGMYMYSLIKVGEANG